MSPEEKSVDSFLCLYDEIIEKKCLDEYRPNPLQDFAAYKEKAKAALMERSSDLVDNAIDGIILLALADGKNETTLGLIDKIFNLDSNPILQNTDAEAFAKDVIEKSPFGLTDEDYDRLVAKADRAEEKGLFKEAAKMYQSLVVLYPIRIEGWLRWGGVAYEHFFDYNKVIDIYNQCVQIFDHPAVYLAMGICHIKGRNYGLAEEALNRALELCDKYDEKDLKAQTQSILDGIK